MASANLTSEARQENTNALRAILGLDEHSASSMLDIALAISIDETCATDELVASEVLAMLERTVQHAALSSIDRSVALELVVGQAASRANGPKLYLTIGMERATLRTTPAGNQPSHRVPGVIALIIACYTCAAMLRHATQGRLPFELPDPFEFTYAELGINLQHLEQPIDIGHAYLAGAGAIGNGLLWAIRHLRLSGRLDIVDDDSVSSGNLNRQIWFAADDIGLGKAVTLAKKAQPQMRNLKLFPRETRLQEVAERSDGPWLRRLIVAVDSRRARRELQNEFPGEVFDASTTDIREIVIHYHRQPTAHACMSCIYEPDQEEVKREQHIAVHLGVSIEEVRTERISGTAANMIAGRFSLDPATIQGTAYDSLFKSLCAQGQLGEVADKRTVASFAFVSVLAGALLAIELCRQLGQLSMTSDFNYWRLSPWFPPIGRRRQLRPQQQNCGFCRHAALAKLNKELWDKASKNN